MCNVASTVPALLPTCNVVATVPLEVALIKPVIVVLPAASVVIPEAAPAATRDETAIG